VTGSPSPVGTLRYMSWSSLLYSFSFARCRNSLYGEQPRLVNIKVPLSVQA
jgi:hypothetical protein